MTDIISLPDSVDAHSLAEWVELVMLIDNIDDFSTTEMLAMFPSGRRPPVQDVEIALGLIEDRSVAGPSLYPFRRIGDRVLRAGHADSGTGPVDDCVYTFFKVACMQFAPWVQQFRAHEIGSLFDYPVRDAMMAWLGAGSRGLVFGWPPREGRPASLVDAVSWLAGQLGLPDGDLDRPPDGNDGGVDCVVWKPPHDERSGFPVWLVQASVEHSIVEKATHVIPLEGWKRWIKFGAGPVTVFATPHSIPRGSNVWMDLNDAAVLVADRDRLINQLHEAGIAGTPPPWLNELCNFVAEQVDTIRNLPDGEPAPRVRRRKRERTSDHVDPLAR